MSSSIILPYLIKKIMAIVTRDAKGFKNDAVAVFTPGEVLSIIENTGSIL
jgi:hypothetical protein